jgi:cytochrome b subunit of formate dehydrogenase
MSRRTATWLAWSMCALSLALTVLSLLILASSISYPGVHIFDFWLENTLAAGGFSTVGAVITSRRPNNVIGWLLNVAGFLLGLNHFSSEYAIYALLARPGSLPGGEAAAWLSYWLFVPSAALVVFLFLLFPTGRLPTRRWRWFAGFSVFAAAIAAVSMAFSSGMAALGPVPNPLGIESVRDIDRIVEPFLFTLLLLAASSMFMRLRRATAIERQQIKWFAYTAAIAVSGNILGHSLFIATEASWLWWVGVMPGMVGVLGMPVAMGIAILRYRLYEIDLLINRTLVYGALTGVLVGLYVGGVVLLQGAFRALTGQESQLAVVASTLVVAAMFNPLRRRIQSFIDRRFYRNKYDARKTLEAFSATLRDETNLEALRGDLVDVVRETMQPAHVSLWFRPSSSGVKDTEGRSRGRFPEFP